MNLHNRSRKTAPIDWELMEYVLDFIGYLQKIH